MFGNYMVSYSVIASAESGTGEQTKPNLTVRQSSFFVFYLILFNDHLYALYDVYWDIGRWSIGLETTSGLGLQIRTL
jgi:hypothetical protein